MKTPVSITVSGNLARAKLLVGRAHKEMATLETALCFQDLPQGVRLVTLPAGAKSPDGGTIKASVRFGIRHVHIHVPLAEGDEQRRLFSRYWYAVHRANHAGGLPADIQENLAGVIESPTKDVYVTGYSNTFDTGNISLDPITIRYSQHGGFLDRRVLHGGASGGVNQPASGSSLAYDCTADKDNPLRGGLYLLSDYYLYRNGDSYDSALTKFAPDGTVKWQRRITFSPPSPLVDFVIKAYGQASDSLGNAIAGGTAIVWERESLSDPWEVDSYRGYIASVRYDGATNWIRLLGDSFASVFEPGSPGWSYPALPGLPSNYEAIRLCQVHDVGVDQSDNIFAVGPYFFDHPWFVMMYHFHPSGLVAKFAPDGTLLWRRVLNCWLSGWTKPDVGTPSEGLRLLYPDGTRMDGCAVGRDGDVYTISWGRPAQGAYLEYLVEENGWFHTHISQISSDGNLMWQRIIETEFSAKADGYQYKGQICTDGGAIYVVFPRHPLRGATPVRGWGIIVCRFDSAGGCLWQRLIEVRGNALEDQYPGAFGVIPWNITASHGDIVIVGQVAPTKATFTIKLPGNGNFMGTHQDLLVSDPGLPVYTSMEQVPVRVTYNWPALDWPGSSLTYKLDFITDAPLTIDNQPLFVTSSTANDYGGPSKGRTTHILLKEKPQ